MPKLVIDDHTLDAADAHPIAGATMGDYVAAWRRARARVHELEQLEALRSSADAPPDPNIRRPRPSNRFAEFLLFVRRFPDVVKADSKLAEFQLEWQHDRDRAALLGQLAWEADDLLRKAEAELGDASPGDWDDLGELDRWLSDVRAWIRQVAELLPTSKSKGVG